MKRPTIADIAARAKVSKGAVSYALNNQPGVSEATRARIMSIAAEMGWTPNSAARALSAARADTIGLVFARPPRTLGLEPFFMEFISGVEDELTRTSRGLLLQVVPDREAELVVYRRWWAARRVDGVIVVDLALDDPRVAVLNTLGLPAVVAGGPGGLDGLTGVWTDDASAMISIVRHLVELGHRRIARVAGLPDLLHTRSRSDAFDTTARELALDSAETMYTDFSDETGARATRSLLSSPQPPTAIIFDNDVMAVASVAMAAEMGLSVPADVSLVAWDDSVLCRLTHPPLTAMSRDVVAYGAHVTRRLLALLDGTPPGIFLDATPHLVSRGTTSAPGQPSTDPA